MKGTIYGDRLPRGTHVKKRLGATGMEVMMQITKTAMMSVIGRGLNPRPPKHESGILSTRQRGSAHGCIFLSAYKHTYVA